MATDVVQQSLSEIGDVRQECLILLKKIRDFCPSKDGKFPEEYRLLATPVLYSAWERCFTMCHAIGLRMVRDLSENPKDLSHTTRAVWLIHTPFFAGFVERVRATTPSEIKKRVKRGQFPALCDFLEACEKWEESGLGSEIDTEELVMTFSNVNPDVVELNARALGIDVHSGYKALKLGRLNDLVGRRNEIGHGGLINPPENQVFAELFSFTEELIDLYCKAFESWMRSYLRAAKSQ